MVAVDVGLNKQTRPSALRQSARNNNAGDKALPATLQSGLSRDMETIRDAFDSAWYVNTYPDCVSAMRTPLEDYCIGGWRDGRDPCAWFSTRLYLARYPDVAAFKVNPFVHYQKFGQLEGRTAVRGAVTSFNDDLIVGWSLNATDPCLPDRIRLSMGPIEIVLETDGSSPEAVALGFANNDGAFSFPLNSLNGDQIAAILYSTRESEIPCEIFSLTSAMPLYAAPVLIKREDVARLALELPGATAEVIGSFDGVTKGYASGWCFQEGNPVPLSLRLRVDGVIVGIGHADRVRTDVAELRGVSRCGFELPLPVRLFDGRAHLVSVEDALTGKSFGTDAPIILHAPTTAAQNFQLIADLEQFLRDGNQLLNRLRKETAPDCAPIESWDTIFRSRLRCRDSDLQTQRQLQRSLPYRPLVSVVMPVYNPVPWMLVDAIESVLAQTYDNWELIIADDASTDDGIHMVIKDYATKYSDRIRSILGDRNSGISVNTNRAIAQAKGEYIAFFDHDDLLEPAALFANVHVLQNRRYALIYSDEDSITPDGRFVHPHLKPDWDPLLLCGINYICHLVIVRRQLIEQVGPLDPAFDGAQDKEFLLRAASAINDSDVFHITQVLYHWRHHGASFSKSATKSKLLADISIRAAESWARQRYGDCVIESAKPAELFAVHVRPKLAAGRVRISVIIPTRDRPELVLDCVQSLLKSRVKDLDIIIVNNDSVMALSEKVFGILTYIMNCRLISYRGAFNWSAINNAAAREAKGDLLLFLNNDTVMLTEDALEQMAAVALDARTGVVGAKMLYGNQRVQHAGVVVGPGGIAGHSFVGLERDDAGYFGYAKLSRTVSAVTGACMMVRRSVFEEFGGFESLRMSVALSDIDFCLKLQQRGLRNAIITTAQFHHFESSTRGLDVDSPNRERFLSESTAFREKWSAVIGDDPYYNPHFDPYGEPYLRIRTNRRWPFDDYKVAADPAMRQPDIIQAG
jgi:glycosyltransferase involved in cell wall biosynthesis